jgi:hypothetical protein
MKNSRFCAALLLALALSSMLGGCIVAADPLPPPGIAVAAYSPLYYDGDVVNYDDWGYPIYYVGGGVRYVPRTYAHYDLLMSHYRAHPEEYRAWYGRSGRGYGHYSRR